LLLRMPGWAAVNHLTNIGLKTLHSTACEYRNDVQSSGSIRTNQGGSHQRSKTNAVGKSFSPSRKSYTLLMALSEAQNPEWIHGYNRAS
jgi:hypothetical protein